MQYNVKDGRVYDQKGNVGVLYSTAYRAPWLAVRKEHHKTLMFFPPLVLYIVSGGNMRDLVSNETGFDKLTEQGKELIGDLFTVTGKISYMEDIKYLNLVWVSPGKMFRVIVKEYREEVECFNEDDWLIN